MSAYLLYIFTTYISICQFIYLYKCHKCNNKTMRPSLYKHNGLMVTGALGIHNIQFTYTMYGVLLYPSISILKCASGHKNMVVITGRNIVSQLDLLR